MDAILEEKLGPDGFWQAYVGNISPQEFMNRQYTPDIGAAAEAYSAAWRPPWRPSRNSSTTQAKL